MIAISITRQVAGDRRRGSWSTLKTSTGRSAMVSCPGCGRIASLELHDINPNGDVHPSIDCLGCNFHEHVRLVDWRKK